jgi:APA family basic amino acid/polyamine antiporter
MTKNIQPKRVVSTRMLALYGVGNIVGAGVYVLVGKIAEPAGYLAILAFIVAALVAFCAALAYAELAARFPVSAGMSVYLYEAFRSKWLSLTVGLSLIVAGTISSAVLLKGFTGYMQELVSFPPAIITVTIALLLTFLMLRGIKESVRAAAVLTLIEVAGLLFLVGSIVFHQPDVFRVFGEHFALSIESFNTTALTGVITASFIAFYAFVGFEDMVNIAEEVKEPQKAYPRAILFAMSLVTILYIVVAAVTLGVMPPEQIGQSSAPLADAYSVSTGQAAGIIAIVSVIATLNGILVNIIMCSRFLYGLGKRQWIPPWFSRLSGRHVPSRALLLVSGIALIAALWMPIEGLAQFTSLLLLFVFLAVNASLIAIRRRDINGKSMHISPRIMPWIGVIATSLLLLGQLFSSFSK